MTPTEEANAKIAAVQAMMTAAEIDALELDKDATFRKLSEAVLAWNALFQASGIVKRHPLAKEIVASAYVILGVLFSYAYALGIRRGERGKALKGKARK